VLPIQPGIGREGRTPMGRPRSDGSPGLNTVLQLEVLEAREVPAINILIDYTLDLPAYGGTGFFTSHPAARQVMEQVAYEMGQRIDARLAAISPSGGNTWTATVYHPGTGSLYSIANLRVPADTIIVYVGGRSIPGAEAGFGGYGGYSWSGSASWGQLLATRQWSGFSLWGGSIAFDSSRNWYFGLDPSGLRADQLDFYSAAVHELGHVLGIGTARQWWSQVQGNQFVGRQAQSIYGGPVPLSSERAHWADGVRVNGQAAAMSPYLYYGRRVHWSALDQAALYDLGWGAPAPAGLSVRFPATRPPVLVSSAGDPTVRVYGFDATGNVSFSGLSFTPFGVQYRGTIRATSADVNGDGWVDYLFATGPGVGARVRVVDGVTGADLLPVTSVLGGFGGGVFLAAGDIDGDGRAEVAIGADAGGDPVVTLARLVSGQLQYLHYIQVLHPLARSGVRVAMGDINGDGRADLITSAGPGWSPVVRIYDGAALASGQIRLQSPAFFAFPSAWRNGVNITAGDLDGDGRAELMTSLDAGGLSLVRVWNGTTTPGTMSLRVQFFANGSTNRDGIRLLARDVDGTGRASLITAPASGSSAWLRVLRLNAASILPLPPIFPPSTIPALEGVFVG
jgi:hypothetical protein